MRNAEPPRVRNDHDAAQFSPLLRSSIPGDRCGEGLLAFLRRKALSAFVSFLLRLQLGEAFLRHLPTNATVGAFGFASNVPALLAQERVQIIQ